MQTSSRLFYPEVISQHAEEAADLWSGRAGFLALPEITLREIGRHDERIEAHVDGLRIAGTAAADVCEEMLPGETGGEIFARFLWAFSTGEAERIEPVIAATAGSVELSRGLVSALGWLRFAEAEPYIGLLLKASSPVLNRAGIAAAAVHRRHPGISVLQEAIASEDADLRSRALRAVGELGAWDALPQTLSRLGDEDLTCQFWAAWSTAVLGSDTRAINVLRSVVESGLATSETALQIVLRRMDYRAARGWMEALFESGKDARSSILGFGILGDPADVPRLIALMDSEELARLSGAAFRMITGLDLKQEYLDRPGPETGTVPGAPEDSDEESSPPDSDADLPWPDRGKVAERWSEVRNEFGPGRRYLLGMPISPESLRVALRVGRQRERAGAALELSVQAPNPPMFNCFAPAPRQLRLLR